MNYLIQMFLKFFEYTIIIMINLGTYVQKRFLVHNGQYVPSGHLGKMFEILKINSKTSILEV